jgi:hypothetical protein
VKGLITGYFPLGNFLERWNRCDLERPSKVEAALDLTLLVFRGSG